MAHLFDLIPPWWALAALLVTTLAGCFVRARFPFLLSLSLLFMVWGALSLRPYLHPTDRLEGFVSDTPVLIEGVVCRRSEGNPAGGGKVFLDVERVTGSGAAAATAGRLVVYVKQGRAEFATGDRILFASKIRKPRAYGIPGEVDQARRLAYQGVFATAFVMEAQDLLLLRAGAGWRHDVDLLAADLGRFIMRCEPGPEGGVLKALLLGDKGDVPEELQDAYARGGVNHILSISGFHVGIVFLSLFHALYLAARCFESLALRLNLKQVLLSAALPVVVFYLFLSGEAAATVRSVLMIGAVVIALHLRREVDPVNSVMLAACAILFAAPHTLFEVSFQLSFIAIWGLVALAPPLAGPFAKAGRVARWFMLLAAASAAAVLSTLVPVAYYFQRVSLVGLIANLIVVPVLGYGAVVAGFLSLALSFVAQPVAQGLLHLAAFLVRLSDQAIHFLAKAPALTAYAPERLDLFLSCLVLGAVTFLRSRVCRSVAVSALLLLLVLRGIPAADAGDGTLKLFFLSVGQGDATLVQLPDGKWMMIDGGGNAADLSARVGPRLLMPALRHLGVRRIDYMVLSHEHPDHLQGLLHLAAHLEVGEFWESGVPSQDPEYRRLKWVLAARGVPSRVVTASQPALRVGGAVLEPLWPAGSVPPPGSMPPPGDANDTSLVFRLSHGMGAVLFTGDVGEKGERELVGRGAVQRCSLLKVAHHGSRYSSCDEFLRAAAPRAAVVSAGYGNSFHLPAPSTLTRMQKRGIRIYRTDLDGTVQAVLRADGGLRVATPWGHFN